MAKSRRGDSLPAKIGGYTVDRSLGSGGMGIVYLGSRVENGTKVQRAIKVLNLAKQAIRDNVDQWKARFRKEYANWQKVSGHPNIVRLFDLIDDGDNLAIVSEYIPGGTLYDWWEAHCRGRESRPYQQVIDFGIGVLTGLAHIHGISKDLVHRDIKPGNIMLKELSPGVIIPLIADFGITRPLHGLEPTTRGPITLEYMAPEAISDIRRPENDIWSVGITLYRLVSDELPFASQDEINNATLPKWLTDVPDNLRKANPELPKWLTDVPDNLRKAIVGALVKNHHFRFQSAEEMIAVLRNSKVHTADMGTVQADAIARDPWKQRYEAYIIELLTKPIILEKKGDGTIVVTIDRDGVQQCIKANQGKTDKFKEHVYRRQEELRKRDTDIHQFLASNGPAEQQTLDLENDLRLELRWASGGVLSIVTHRERKWVPLFFRDIRPYGWNISLGSTERRFDNWGKVSGTPTLHDELCYPTYFICREFQEESLLLKCPASVINLDQATRLIDLNPTPESTLAFRNFDVGFLLTDLERRDQYRDTIRKLRDHEPCLGIQSDDYPQPLTASFSRKAPFSTKVIANNKPTVDSGLLVCFSLLDLGIEVVKVLEYDLGNDHYMLDGELQLADGGVAEELVRMPIALLSYEYLQQRFGPGADWISYTDGPAASIKVAPPNPDQVLMFSWDIRRRMDIVRGTGNMPDPSRGQMKRYLDWYDKFGSNFLDKHGNPSCSKLPGLFVPATAKILNLYFSTMAKVAPE